MPRLKHTANRKTAHATADGWVSAKTDEMLIREWYAGQVMPVLVGDYLSRGRDGVLSACKRDGLTPEQYLARAAFLLADAMLHASRGE